MNHSLKPTLRLLLATVLLALMIAPVAAQEAWVQLGLTNCGIKCAAVAPGNSNTIVAGGANLYVSTDGGTTWSTKTDLADVYSISFGSNANVAYAGCWGRGVFKSTDGCATWVAKNNGLGNTVVKCVLVSPTDDNTVYATTESGLWFSMDGGDSWSNLYGGVNGSAVAVLPAASPGEDSVIYLGTWGGGLWKYSGGTMGYWSPLTVGTVPTGAACNAIAVDPVDGNIVYAVFQGQGVWASYDGGASWKQLTPSFEGFCVAADKSRPGFVYGVGGWSPPYRSGCYGGTGWIGMSASWMGGSFARSMSVDPNNPAKIYAGGYNGGLYRWIADIQAPSAPGTLTAVASGNGIKLTWGASASSDCTGYWIYRRQGATGTYPPTPYMAVNGKSTTTFTDIGVVAGSTYYYKMAAMDAAQNHSTLTNEANSTVLANYDLDVTYIERTPRDTYRYSVDYPNDIPNLRAGTENLKRWPNYGETVTFTAHFKNKGTANPGTVNYRWTINGVVAGTGSITGIDPGAEGTASIPWVWNTNGLDTDHSDQTVKFEIDYDTRITETFEQNNSLTDYIGAVTLIVCLEPALYDALNSRANLTGTFSAEDWLQKQMLETNKNFARSTYPLAPNGALERMRIDKIIVGSLPPDDATYDGRWYISGGSGYADTFAMGIDGGLVHEWMHQIGLIDLYNFPVSNGLNLVQTPDGVPNNMSFDWGRPDLMAGGDIDPHTSSPTAPQYLSQEHVVALNTNCGYRRGYYGEFMFDVPTNNYLLIKDSAGNIAPNVTVKIYQSNYGALPATPLITGTTDANGIMLLPNRAPAQFITTATGHTEKANPLGTIYVVGGRETLLVEMSRPGGDFDYTWMNQTMFNLAYWGGNTNEWTYTINSRLGASTLPRMTQVTGAVEATKVTLAWPAVPGAVSYRIYRASRYLNQASDTTHQYENYIMRRLNSTTALSYIDTTISETSLYAVTAVDANGKESPLSNRIFAPRLINPWSVAVQSDGKRVVLDPQNGYALLRQMPDGTYLGNFGSVHYHLEYSKFMVIDRKLGRMIFSHPRDEYSTRHSIRVSDLNCVAITEIGNGDNGSSPGQFNNPTGVAVDAESRIYAADGNNRIQVFSSSGTLLTYFGTAGTGNGQFNNPQGIAVDANHRIYVCDNGNKRVQILQFSTANNTITYVGALQGRTFVSPIAVAIAPSGDIYVTDNSSSRNSVEAFSASGNFMHTYTQANGVYTGNLNYPTGVTVDDNGVLIVCDTNNKRVVTITPTATTTAAAARSLADNTVRQLEGAIVTAKFSGNFYIQEVGRKPGMRVVSAAAVSVGQMVDIYGTVKTVNGEREIQATVAVGGAMATVQPKPHALTLKTMGGGPFGPVPGITGASGLNNVGLLVKVFGTTSERNTTASTFSLDDGSGFTVKVYAPGLTIPADGSHVIVTGISGAEKPSADTVRVLRARSIDTP